MMVLITGGAGYIGSHLLLELSKLGCGVVVLDDLSNSSTERLDCIKYDYGKKFNFVRGSFLDRNVLKDVFSTYPISCVVHLASPKSIPESYRNPSYYLEEIPKGTRVLLSEMVEYGVFNIVYSSSVSVGYSESPYTLSKSICENIIENHCGEHENFNAICLRYSNPIGNLDTRLADSGRSNIIPKILSALDSGTTFQVFGADFNTSDGTSVRDYVDIMDLTRANVLAVKNINRLCGYSLIDIGSGVKTSVLDLIAKIGGILKIPIPFEFLDSRDGDFGEYTVDMLNSSAVLGWCPTMSVEYSLYYILKELVNGNSK